MISSLHWDEYYMAMAITASFRSKDPNTKVGAVLVKGSTAVIGYNGFPRGIADLDHRWVRPAKYRFVVHAEANALNNAQFDTYGSKIYITHYPPCNECTKMIIQKGVKEVICGTWKISKRSIEESASESINMLSEAGILLRRLDSDHICDRMIDEISNRRE